ncbi:motilin receptor [Cygnus olor]|uniref:motilin receptor n=1 Tax=Cygnus atratus TaxID=8868 RepID=UPI0015D62C9F|nr:motilin receptor [Cygnus atratus]XP_040398286.1 motilin receptor [Cygnus olor]
MAAAPVWGGGGNGSQGEASWPGQPCDERLCSALPVRALIPVTAVCAGLFAVGVVGNVLTVLVVCGQRDMKTTTNLYLGSMAVSDLLILLGLPLDLYRLWRSRPWIFGQLLCRLSHYLSEGCTYCTILHITALTVERYLAICFPLKAKVVVTKRRVKAVIGALWAFALLSAGPFFFLVGVEQPDNRTDFGRECKPTPQALESGLLATMFWVTTTYFVLPVLCLNVLYGFIGRELWRSKGRLQGPSAALRERGHRQTVKILAVVILAFIICWLPFHIGRIIFINTQDTRMMLFSQYFNIFALQLFYLSASINPILYNLISKKYRAAVYKLLLPHRSAGRAFAITKEAGGYTETSTSMRNK